jgi:hypothetical protein
VQRQVIHFFERMCQVANTVVVSFVPWVLLPAWRPTSFPAALPALHSRKTHLQRGGCDLEAEAQLIVQRASLRWLAQRHPSWTRQELATTLGKSLAWVKKWLKRLREAEPGDVMALHARSRARTTPPVSIASQTAVVQRILEIRESPPENLHRVPGPEAIVSYLHRDPALQKAGVRLPRSQTTVWKILRTFGCIAHEPRRKPRPLERKHPGEEVQLDLKDAITVPADPPSASSSMWWKSPTLSMRAPRSG